MCPIPTPGRCMEDKWGGQILLKSIIPPSSCWHSHVSTARFCIYKILKRNDYMQIKYKRKNLDSASSLCLPSSVNRTPEPIFPHLAVIGSLGAAQAVTRDLSTLLTPPPPPLQRFLPPAMHHSPSIFTSIGAEVHESHNSVPLAITDVYVKPGGGRGHLERQHEVKSTCCSCRGPVSGSDVHMATHNHR